MSAVQVRTMTVADLPLAMRLRDQAGWNQTEADLQRFLALSPQGCFVASIAGTDVGTVATFTFGPVAWIAMVLVDESHRGQGIGKALMRHALEWLDARGVQSIRLDATPLGQPLYATLGFEMEFELDRYAGRNRLYTHIDDAIRLNVEHIDEVVKFDRSITGTDRGELLRALFAEFPHEARIVLRECRVLGYATARPGCRATMIGPCMGIEDAGMKLLAKILTRHVDENVFVDVPRLNQAAAMMAKAAGLTPQRPLVRMCRGRSVGEQPQHIWASSGPEKG